MGNEDAWSSLRQGARNVAGVSWQIEATTHMLVLGRCGLLNWTNITPEGIEDADCRDTNGFVTYVQMKEVRAGHGRMTAASIADAIAHGHRHAEGRPLVVLTDGELGSGLSFTGWDADMLAQMSQGVQAVRQHLVLTGIPEGDTDQLLGKTFLVRLPWDLRPTTERLLVEHLGVVPAVSGIAVSRLNGLMAVASANQRTTTAESAHSLSIRDVDAVLAEVQSTVDFEGLDKAVAAGVCAPARYVEASNLTNRQFFLGRDGAPGIIAAGLDVVRPAEMQDILSGFQTHNYSLILGPSGSGKSVLLWRAARDIFVGAGVLRVLRLSTSDDVELLVRHAALQRPSQTAPLVVAADNLGRPNLSAWPDAVRRLREMPWVFLLGAVRSEDFSPRLVSGGAAIVEPTLDVDTAVDIASAIQESGIELCMAPEEAQDRAQGLLMEYLALLIAGQRFRDVIAEQVEGLREPNRRIERTLARWVTAAHALGLGIEAEALPRLLKEQDDAVGDALNRLRGEHVVLRSEAEWRGLHELRSATISELLHESPPPTLAQTHSQVAQAVALPLGGWFLRRIAQEAPDAVIAAADAVSHRVAGTHDPDILASILEGAERADSLIYAAHTLPILRRSIRPPMTVHDAGMMAYSMANHGFSFEGIPVMAQGEARFSRIADLTGPRRSAVAQTVVGMISGRDLVRLTAGAGLNSTARLLEACQDVVQIGFADAQTIYSRVPKPKNATDASIHARIISSLSLLAELTNAQISACFGPLETRAAMLTETEPWALGLEAVESDDGTVVSVKVLGPNSDGSSSVTMPSDPTQERSTDLVNDQAVRVARRIAEGCPEVDVVEIRTLGPGGSPYVMGGFEPGHKRLKRSVFPRRDTVRRSVSYQAALRRLDASSTWTDLVREQVRIARQLTELVEQGCSRISATDNTTRRREWISAVSETVRSVALLKARPVAVAVDPDVSHAQTDRDERSHDPLTRIYETIAGILQDLPDQRIPSGIAIRIQGAVTAVEAAEREGFPTLGSVGTPLPSALKAALRRLLDLQRAVAAWPSAAQNIRARPESIDAVIARVVEDTRTREDALLRTVLAGHSEYQIIRATSNEPRADTVDGCDLVVTAELSTIDDLLSRLGKAKDQLEEGLTAWVYIVATHENMPLPVVLRLATSMTTDFLPVPEDKRKSVFQAAGLVGAREGGPESVNVILEEVVDRSYRAALFHLRDRSWPRLVPEGSRTVRLNQSLVDQLPSQGVGPLLKLREQVVAEEAGLRRPGQLADALLNAISGEPPEDDQEALLHAVFMASFIGWDNQGELA